ncbi:quinone oxidoreductase family protein [Sphingopyxis terrae]|jgi:NADPH2:quinone reductase|uniref:NADPH2:quinone reductase n=3 Tax=Sphingopyxis TaxID=165697 RepID=A0A1Y6FT79_9SPHN|nr:quinone oxidoreductase [Sphingopyxis terrae subsp. ummariensis]SMQ77376.1 NADPH2:quinone reductase [Sphingopyxis terrae subsp. ummariensis]
MARVVKMHAVGDAAVLRVDDQHVSDPGPGEIRLRQAAAGVNYVDIYHRTGLYPVAHLPAVLGVEGAGVVEALGDGVTHLRPGDRVAWAGLPMGGYAETRLLAANRAVPLPSHISDTVAAASMLRGITAHMLLTRVARISPGDIILIHAAAGGLGLILSQWARKLGASVIGTVGSPEKAALAKSFGLDHAVLYKESDFVREVLNITGGRGVDVAFDGIGGDVLLRTLDCVRPFGVVVSAGQASGSLPVIDISELGPRRSLAFARPSVLAYMADLDSYRKAAAELFEELETGLHVEIGAQFDLADVAKAHSALEAGRTTGSVLLTF